MSEPRIELSVQASPAGQASWVELARRCESTGFRALLVSDHPGTGPSPFVALAAAAAVTSTLRLGSYVVNAGVRDPLLLASEVATLDVVSNGRAELGLGAGHTPSEWAMTGRTRPPPAERVQALIAVTTVVRELLAGRTVPAEAAGALAEVQLSGPRPVQEPLPVLVGGGNPALLRWGGAHADAVGLSGLGRTLPDGHAHTVSWSPEQVDAHVALVREGAAGAGIAIPPLEALVQHVELTDDRTAAARPLALETGLSVEDVLAVPYVLIGTVAQIVEQLGDARKRWGITRCVVRIGALDIAEQVLATLRS
jgi:probable F420-dependent oxidoreductase